MLPKNHFAHIYVGKIPIIKAKTVNPNAVADLHGNIFDNAVNVIGIVI
ncbi:MAG: hypothetical protein WCG25_08435 [bacterium]